MTRVRQGCFFLSLLSLSLLCWDTQSEKTGLWQLPIVSSVFKVFYAICIKHNVCFGMMPHHRSEVTNQGMREKSNGPHCDLNPRPLTLRADALPTVQQGTAVYSLRFPHELYLNSMFLSSNVMLLVWSCSICYNWTITEESYFVCSLKYIWVRTYLLLKNYLLQRESFLTNFYTKSSPLLVIK